MSDKDKIVNGILIKKSNDKDVKVIEKIIDEEERKKNEEMDSKIHSYNPNKGFWKN